jgi:hypothetical protein
MIIEVLRDNKPLMMLYPEKRRFVTTLRMALLPNRRAVLVLAGAPQPAAQKLPHGLTASVAFRESHD